MTRIEFVGRYAKRFAQLTGCDYEIAFQTAEACADAIWDCFCEQETPEECAESEVDAQSQEEAKDGDA